MKVTQTTRGILAARKERARMQAAGYRQAELDWSLVRGAYYETQHRITDVVIAEDGKSVWFKTNIPSATGDTP
jgi:hypothetical protein